MYEMLEAASSSTWGTVLVALISGVFGLAGYALKWYLDRRTVKKKNAMKDYLSLHNDVYHNINDELQKVGAKRIIVVKIEDGGGVPKPGSPIYTSVVWEAFDPPITSIQKDWQRQRVDAEFSDIIANMIHHGSTRIIVEKLDENSLIRNFCEASGIMKTEIHHVHANESRILYLSIAYTDDVDLDEPFRRTRTSVLANNLSQIMDKMETLEKQSS